LKDCIFVTVDDLRITGRSACWKHLQLFSGVY